MIKRSPKAPFLIDLLLGISSPAKTIAGYIWQFKHVSREEHHSNCYSPDWFCVGFQEWEAQQIIIVLKRTSNG